MLGKSQDQTAAENAIALQVGGSADSVSVNQTNNTQNVSSQTNNYGVTVEQVRSIVSDAFKAEFYKFLDHAGDIATARAQKLCDAFLARVEKENPAALNQANNPDFRYSLLTAQKAQARSGDENLEALLVELLVERSREEQRNLQQIVLNEALEVAARLTEEHVAALTVIFILRKSKANGIVHLDQWLEWMDLNVQPFIAKAKLSEASFSHMAFTGCGALEMGEITLAEILSRTYPGFWQAGFPPDDPVYQQLTPRARQLTRPSVHTPGRFEVMDGSTDTCARLREHILPDPAERSLIDQLLNRQRLDHEQIKARCIASRAYMSALFDLWDTTSAKRFMLQSVGIAIGHANLSRINPAFGPLSIWVN